jgi:MoaA/NifB/PqqE/SkfB family radical SAM enzyme
LEEINKGKALLYMASYYGNFPLVKPDFINFGLTHRCNLRCKICETWEADPNTGEELTLKELKNVITQIAKWGDINLSFAGGEPLMRMNDLIECIKHAKRNGLTTHVTTNGTMIDRKAAEEIVNSGLDCLQISLDGITEKTNDYIRGRGSFRGAMRAIRHIKKRKNESNSDLKVSITTVVTDKNVGELLDIYNFVKAEGIDEVAYNPYTADNSYMGNADYEKDEFWVSGRNIGKLRKVCEKLIKLKNVEGRIGTPEISLRSMPEYFGKKGGFRSGICLAGYSYMYVKPNGDVDVCGKGPSLNVKNTGIKSIWYSPQFAKARLKIASCRKPCMMLCFPRVSFKDIIS